MSSPPSFFYNKEKGGGYSFSSPQKLENTTPLVGEVQALRREVQILRHQILHDDLTNLPNRRYFRREMQKFLNFIARMPAGQKHPPLDKEYKNNISYALILIDIDKFKSINDGYGHMNGDKILCLFADILKKLAGHHFMLDGINPFSARIGGDEFAVITAANQVDDVRHFCEKLQQNFTEECHDFLKIDGHFIYGLSIGVALLDGIPMENKENMDKLYENWFYKCDNILYKVKQDGGHKIIIEQV